MDTAVPLDHLLPRLQNPTRMAERALPPAVFPHGDFAPAPSRWIGALLAQLPVGVLITDAAGTFVRTNAAARSLVGTCEWPAFDGLASAGGPGGRPHAALWERLQWELARVLLMGEQIRDERLVLTSPDGAKRTLSLSATPIREPGGVVSGAVVTLADVTDSDRLAKLAPMLETLGRL